MIYMFLADGFEETEAIAPLDIMRRAGAEVATVGVGAKTVTGTHGIKVTADICENEIDFSQIDGVVLPGGMPGTLNLGASDTVNKAIDIAAQKGVLLAAICAAPSVLGQKELLVGKRATCYPGFEDKLIGAKATGAPVESDGNVITAWGAGAAMRFGLEIVAFLYSKEKADELEASFKCTP